MGCDDSAGATESSLCDGISIEGRLTVEERFEP